MAVPEALVSTPDLTPATYALALAGARRRAGLRAIRARGAVFFPSNGVAARLLAPFDPLLSHAGARGAAFLAVAADKEIREL